MKRMKIQTSILAACLMMMASVVVAQGPQRGKKMSPEKRAEKHKEMIYEEVDGLTDDQKEQIELVFEETGEKAKKLKEETNEKVRPQMKEIRNEMESKFEGIMTEDQYAQYTAAVEKKRSERKDRRQGGGPEGPAPGKG